MPVSEEEKKQYGEFLAKIAHALKSLEVKSDELVWHYTTGSALINIVESGELYATQVSCLNDSTEGLYASTVLRDAFLAVQSGSLATEEARLLADMIKAGFSPSGHIPSRWFIACFTPERDDLSQWRAYGGGENGYALGFHAGGFFGRDPHSLVVHVNYDRGIHEALAKEIATTTLNYFREGLQRRDGQYEVWSQEFLAEWNSMLSYLEPLVKDPAFRAENEYRIVRELMVGDMGKLRFRQKQSLMSRHLPLRFSDPNKKGGLPLPLAAVMVGPGRHKEISRTSVDTLLKQNGYLEVPVYSSEIPFQST